MLINDTGKFCLERSVQLNSLNEQWNSIVLKRGGITFVTDAHGSNSCKVIRDITALIPSCTKYSMNAKISMEVT